jgi:hypothetical protein
MQEIKLTDLIYREKNFLSDAQCQALIDEYELRKRQSVLEECPEATTGKNTTSTFKRIVLESGTDNHRMMFEANETLINKYHDYLDTFESFHVQRRASMMYSHLYRLMKYEPGEKIHPHTDHGKNIYGSAVFNLNDGYTGGDFVFWKGRHRVKLEKGEAMIFPADYFWVHEVEPIETGVRYSTNSFLCSIAPYKFLNDPSVDKNPKPYNIKHVTYGKKNPGY